MTAPTPGSSWQTIHDEIIARIRNRYWKPGELIPNEADLALEFGCARATINRALRNIADQGWIERKRKAGTRVRKFPDRKTTLSIPLIRDEIETKKNGYEYRLISRSVKTPPKNIQKKFGLRKEETALLLTAVHSDRHNPYVFEKRWINSVFIPETLAIDFSSTSANEWLISNAPLTDGDFAFSAIGATAEQATHLNIDKGTPLFNLERVTWHEGNCITLVNLTFYEGYELKSVLRSSLSN